MIEMYVPFEMSQDGMTVSVTAVYRGNIWNNSCIQGKYSEILWDNLR